MPSLPATDDGSTRPLAEDLSTGSGGSEDIAWDADTEPGTADAGVAPDTAGADGGPRPIETGPHAAEAGAEQGVAGVDAEPEFTGSGGAFLSAPAETGSSSAGPSAPESGIESQSQADGSGTRITTRVGGEPRAGDRST